MEVRSSDDARATAARWSLKEAWSKRASRWTKTGYKAPAPDERATYCEVHIHQRREA
jgi:phosphopantetheinyl transferase (holo-ACP synthase)